MIPFPFLALQFDVCDLVETGKTKLLLYACMWSMFQSVKDLGSDIDLL